MFTHRCPCCNTEVKTLANSLVFHPCPARNGDHRNFKVVSVASKTLHAEDLNLQDAEHFDGFVEHNTAMTFEPIS